MALFGKKYKAYMVEYPGLFVTFYMSFKDAQTAMNDSFQRKLQKLREGTDYSIADYSQKTYECNIDYSDLNKNETFTLRIGYIGK